MWHRHRSCLGLSTLEPKPCTDQEHGHGNHRVAHNLLFAFCHRIMLHRQYVVAPVWTTKAKVHINACQGCAMCVQ